MDYIDGLNEERKGETEVYAVATGNFPSIFAPRKLKKASKQAIDLINRQEGFCGYHPMPPRGTLCLFLTENNAKAARNVMRSRGIPVGDNITKVFVPTADVDYAREKIEKFNAKQKG